MLVPVVYRTLYGIGKERSLHLINRMFSFLVLVHAVRLVNK